MTDICWMTATELVRAYKRKKLSPVEVTQALLDRIDRINPKLNAFITLVPEIALKAARQAEKAYLDGEPGPLAGVPIAIKDNTFTRGIRTTGGSRMNENFIPDRNAVLVDRLLEAGVILLGKTNMPEFGIGGITDNILFGKTVNPWDLTRTPGGSSGGSAAAVAAGLCPIAQGNDAGGSIRLPAAFCGIFGMKPTFGRIPVNPRFFGSETRIHQGPLTRSVEDASVMLDVMSGPTLEDATSLPPYQGSFRKEMKKPVKGLKIAYTHEIGGDSTMDHAVLALFKQAVAQFKELGCTVEEIKPDWINMENDFLATVLSELYTRYENDKEAFDKLARPLYYPIMEMGTGFTNRDMVRIQFHRVTLCEQVAQVFKKYDLLLTPSTAVTAFTAGDMGPMFPETINGEPVKSRGTWARFQYTFNFTFQPAASVPCGFTEEGLPAGLQIVSRRFEESTLLRAAAAFEKACPWRGRKPEL